MLTELFNLAVIAVPAIALGFPTLKSMFFNAGQQQNVLITRFGRHTRTIDQPGLKIKIPFIDKVAARIGLDLQQAAEELKTKTKDDLFVSLPIAVQYQITDSPKFWFKNRDGVANMMKLVSAAVRTSTSGKEFQELYTDRDGISAAVIEHIQKDVEDFGITIKRIIIDQPTAPAEVQNAFNEVRASERLKEAAKNKADAHFIEAVRKAEGDRDAQILAGKGAKGFREEVLTGYADLMKSLTSEGHVSKDEAYNLVMEAMRLDAMRDVAAKGNVIVIPQNMPSGSSSLADIKTLQQLSANGNKPHGPVARPA